MTTGTYDARRAFQAMPRSEQELAIRRLMSTGHTEHTAAAATGLSVEAIRRAIGEGENYADA
jgi:hypothetical protein